MTTHTPVVALAALLLAVSATAQAAPTTHLVAPAVAGQTARFVLRHPTTSAGRLYLTLLATPVFSGAIPVNVPGMTVNGLLRVQAATAVVGGSGIMDSSGQTQPVAITVPNSSSLIGFAFEVQGLEWHLNTLTFASNDVEVVVAGSPPIGLSMAPIPAGVFAMGSSAAGGAPYYGNTASQPVHSVAITRPFWMGRFEVTQAQFQSLMGTNPSNFLGINRPVESVTWNEAVAYCQALTASEQAAGRVPTGYQYRLPTEAEWEYCCRAGTTAEFHTGAALFCGDARIEYSQHSASSCNIPTTGPGSGTLDVGSFPPNAFGLHDMHGNVREWCLDAYAAYAPGAVADPLVQTGSGRVDRGGAFNFASRYARSAYRESGSPGTRLMSRGFRVVLAPILP
jgi:formylglycine-generating enzyme required for sulfatase activity